MDRERFQHKTTSIDFIEDVIVIMEKNSVSTEELSRRMGKTAEQTRELFQCEDISFLDAVRLATALGVGFSASLIEDESVWSPVCSFETINYNATD